MSPTRSFGVPAVTFACACLVLAACTQTKSAAKDAPASSAGVDSRTAIRVSEATRLAVLTEMRTMLKAVQGVMAGVANKDTAAVRASASSAGVQVASEMNPTIEAELGADFVQLGMRTHLSFDSLANGAGGKSGDATLRRLATVMGNCVGCHEQWRLVVKP